jgi:hypothetical protein
MRTDGFFDVVINEKPYYLSMTRHKIYDSSSRFDYYIIIAMTREQQILEAVRLLFEHEKTLLAGRRVVLFGSRAAGKAKTRFLCLSAAATLQES